MVKCRPFYLPREISAFIVTVVYIPPQYKKNNNLALNELYKAINKQETLHPEVAFLVAGAFNSASLIHGMPNFHQYVSNATRGDKVIPLLFYPQVSIQGLHSSAIRQIRS